MRPLALALLILLALFLAACKGKQLVDPEPLAVCEADTTTWLLVIDSTCTTVTGHILPDRNF